MIEHLLTTAGYDTRTANDPSEALTVATLFRPQIAILDIGLPVIDGYTLARELLLRLADNPPTLIALTGYSQEEDKIRSKNAGFALHLVKPVDAEHLVEVLDSLDDRIP
jgi:DNA-binding response OmpR family regulator